MTPLSTNNVFPAFSLNGVTLQPFFPLLEQGKLVLQQGNLPETVRILESMPEGEERSLLSKEISGVIFAQYKQSVVDQCQKLDPEALAWVFKRIGQRLFGIEKAYTIDYGEESSLLASMHEECRQQGLQRFVNTYANVTDEGRQSRALQVISFCLFEQRSRSVRDVLRQVYPKLSPLGAHSKVAPLIDLNIFFSFLDQENRDVATAVDIIQAQEKGSWIKKQFVRFLADDLYEKDYKVFYKEVIRQYPTYAQKWMQAFSKKSKKVAELYEQFLDEIVKEKIQTSVGDAFTWIAQLPKESRTRAYWTLLKMSTHLEPQKVEALFRDYPDQICVFADAFEVCIPEYFRENRDESSDYSALLLRIKSLADHLSRCNLRRDGQTLSEMIHNARPALCGHQLQRLLNQEVRDRLFSDEYGLFNDLVAEEEGTESQLDQISTWIPFLTDGALQDQIRVSCLKFYAASSQFEKAHFVLRDIHDPKMQALAFEHLTYHSFLSSTERGVSQDRKTFLQKQAESYLKQIWKRSPETYNSHLDTLIERLLLYVGEEMPVEIYESVFKLLAEIDDPKRKKFCLEEIRKALDGDLEDAEFEERKEILRAHLARVETLLQDGLSELSLS